MSGELSYERAIVLHHAAPYGMELWSWQVRWSDGKVNQARKYSNTEKHAKKAADAAVKRRVGQ